MSFSGEKSGNQNSQQLQNNSQNNANFDTTSFGNNRDPWNNRVKQQNQNNNNNNDNNNNSNNDNAGIDDEVIAKIWEKVENKDNQQQPNNGNNQQQPNNQQQVDPQKQMQDYLNSVGLGEFVISDAEKEAMTNGDFSGIMTRMNQRVIDAHTKALSSANQLIDKKIADAVGKVKDSSVSYMMGQQNVSELNKQLPWTKEKHIAPVAQSVMQKFLDRGMTTEKAIQGVKAYFDDINTRMNSGNTNRSSNYSSGTSEQEKAHNWLSVLSPGN